MTASDLAAVQMTRDAAFRNDEASARVLRDAVLDLGVPWADSWAVAYDLCRATPGGRLCLTTALAVCEEAVCLGRLPESSASEVRRTAAKRRESLDHFEAEGEEYEGELAALRQEVAALEALAVAVTSMRG